LNLNHINNIDPDVAKAIYSETERQKNTLELIASENIASTAVMAAQGSIFTNKYAEGYPGKRYYGGCEHVDIVEHLAIERAKKLFGAAYANVQPHSGSQANMAVYFALLKPGDTVLGMDLSHGGHLTHGSSVSFSGKLFNFIHYGVNKDTEIIDFEKLAGIADKYRPRLIVAGASAYCRILDFKVFSKIAKSVGAYLMVDMAHIAGLVAAGVHPSPFPYADIVTSTTHKTLRGPRGGLILAKKDYSDILNKEIFPGIQGGPLMHVIAAKAVAFKEALSNSFEIYQKNVVNNAKVLANCLIKGGFRLVSGGTDNHMLLVDLRNFHISGKNAEELLGRSGITVNKNSIPFEKQSPFITSGIRIGTPAVTTRGMGWPEMELIGTFIIDVLKNHKNENIVADVKSKVQKLCEKFPLY